MAKKSKTVLPEIECDDFLANVEDASVILLMGSVPNKKVVKNVVKSFVEIGENNFNIVGFFGWNDKRKIMDNVFNRISKCK